MSKIRIIFILIGVAFLFLTHIGETSYRGWSYSNNISDFGLANYITSITGTIAASFFLIGFSKESVEYPNLVFGVIVGCALYEILQPVLGTGVFDRASGQIQINQQKRILHFS